MKLLQPYQTKVLNTVKVVLLLLTFGFIFYKLFYAYHIDELFGNFRFTWSANKCFLLLGVVTLMVINWSLEAAKWRLLMNKNESLSFSDAVKAVVSGITLSIVTPNQVGDFAGRVLHLRKFDKIKGSLVTVIGHTAQVIMTLAFGLFAFIKFFVLQEKISAQPAFFLSLLLFALIIIAIVAFLHIHLVNRISKSEKITAYTKVFAAYTRYELAQVLTFAFLRYVIFVLQYLLLLSFYDVSLPVQDAVYCIMATLCAQSFVPSFILVEIGMRGASALFFFTFFTGQAAAVLLSAYSLWIVNLMFPALLGLWVILKLKLNR